MYCIILMCWKLKYQHYYYYYYFYYYYYILFWWALIAINRYLHMSAESVGKRQDSVIGSILVSVCSLFSVQEVLTNHVWKSFSWMLCWKQEVELAEICRNSILGHKVYCLMTIQIISCLKLLTGLLTMTSAQKRKSWPR